MNKFNFKKLLSIISLLTIVLPVILVSGCRISNQNSEIMQLKKEMEKLDFKVLEFSISEEEKAKNLKLDIKNIQKNLQSLIQPSSKSSVEELEIQEKLIKEIKNRDFLNTKIVILEEKLKFLSEQVFKITEEKNKFENKYLDIKSALNSEIQTKNQYKQQIKKNQNQIKKLEWYVGELENLYDDILICWSNYVFISEIMIRLNNIVLADTDIVLDFFLQQISKIWNEVLNNILSDETDKPRIFFNLKVKYELKVVVINYRIFKNESISDDKKLEIKYR